METVNKPDMDKNPRVAWLGLGRMGLPMARRLLDAGHPLTVWNRTASRAQGLGAAGAKVASTAAEAVAGADVVVTMLADPAALTEVAEAVLPALRPGTVWVEMSSVGPEAVRALAARLPQGVRLVDAPVMGSVDCAASGELAILAGGEVAPVADLLARLGTVQAVGPVGEGAALKTVLIGAVVGGVALVAEALALADALGLPEGVAERALAAGPLAPLLARARATTAEFAVSLAAKDVALGTAAAHLPIAEAVLATLRAHPAIADADLSALTDAGRAASASA
ncbi:3-hydroxyisobutyrate dehydrogenase-like beta-hydroxyacid dehydrogenase [Streptacidiphilus sp. MAP12-33]|uniref:NAD(P)-dependent oxidoreductase n=1 Tax=Streptacidiphilus sp. MAP12-33 TaxID=3156266 RepID=UPI003511598C